MRLLINNIKDTKGVTLIELLVVVSIVGILVIALGFSYEGWIGNYRLESATKDMYADLMEAKTRALTRTRAHFITITATQYIIYEDTNTAPDGNGTLETASDTVVLQKTIANKYELKMVSAGAFPQTIIMDTRGMITPVITFRIDPGHPACCPTKTCGATDALRCRYPDYDCILVSQIRIQTGKYNGTTTTCDPK
ncbi:MAG: prepilin-type N-terminal cleavage/methylation domain-containing protein [Thermodesulfovibrionales bacterium]|nr:prepilin-type N-terminal cleavage/methylation domain-containing protein [Thermodesulfovibrionales bacterium]